MQAPKSILFSSLALVAAAVFLGPTAPAEESDASLQQVRDKVTAMFDTIEAKDVNISPVDGWYTIQKGSIVAYISTDGRYLLQGDLIDLEQNVNVSEAARNQSRRELMASVKDEDVILFSPAEKKYSVSVFTDVECTYCRRLHNQIDEYLAHGIEVRYLMYPRNGPTSNAWTTAEHVWCASDRNGALTAAKNDRQFAFTDCDASIVQNQYQMGQEVGLSGTPAIVLDDGTLISGYLPPDQLKARLDIAAN
ncbi:MAG: thioredoxin fold domain-containing protein [Gammaproteobacteria bacterium]|nr:thioredoxin fold domain-containing protein [Gammaproteobacteria bacterium]